MASILFFCLSIATPGLLSRRLKPNTYSSLLASDSNVFSDTHRVFQSVFSPLFLPVCAASSAASKVPHRAMVGAHRGSCRGEKDHILGINLRGKRRRGVGLHSQNTINSPPLTSSCVLSQLSLYRRLSSQCYRKMLNWEKNGAVGYVFTVVMRPHVASSILNLVNHQVSEGCFTGNPQRTAASEGVCNNQMHITDSSSSSYGDINLHSSLNEINVNFSHKKHLPQRHL